MNSSAPFTSVGTLANEIVLRLARQQAASKGYAVAPVKDRTQWLEMRHRDVTASVAAALLGAHEYVTPLELWSIKREKFVPEQEETPAMRRGRLLEPVALQLLAEERPTWTIEHGTTYHRDPARRLGATPDAFAIDPDRDGFGIVQIKTVEPSIFRRKWKDESGFVEPPLWIAVQAILEAELTGASWAAVAAMVCGFGVELYPVEIPLHAGILSRLHDATADFWTSVATGDAPNPDFSRDGALLAAMYGNDDGTEIDLTGDNAVLALASEDAQLAFEIKGRETRRKEIKAEVLSKLGAHAVGTYDGRVICTGRTVHRKAYSVKECSYRDIRVKALSEATR